MKKTKFQLKHKRERNHRRSIDKEYLKEANKSFRFATEKKFPKSDVILIGQGEDALEVQVRINKLGQLCEIQSSDPTIQSLLYGRPYNSVIQ